MGSPGCDSEEREVDVKILFDILAKGGGLLIPHEKNCKLDPIQRIGQRGWRVWFRRKTKWKFGSSLMYSPERVAGFDPDRREIQLRSYSIFGQRGWHLKFLIPHKDKMIVRDPYLIIT